MSRNLVVDLLLHKVMWSPEMLYCSGTEDITGKVLPSGHGRGLHSHMPHPGGERRSD